MSNIPIFDSLTHPMPNSNWLSQKYDGQNSVQDLLAGMKSNNVKWAFAVGLGPSIGGYEEETYSTFIRSQSEKLFPVAFFDFKVLDSGVSVVEYLSKIKHLGYYGIKIHPRLSNISLLDSILPNVIKEANQLGLLVLLCTYFWSNNKKHCSDSPEQLLNMLCAVPEDKIILLHSGAVRLLEVAEIARHFREVLLDLSFTLCKYEKSSIDMDIRYVFEKLDRRVCIGSDSPEFDLFMLRKRFEYLTEGLELEKKENIGYQNLKDYIGIHI